MTLEQEYTLSFYREITEINRTHRVSLVQHTETQQLFVKKVLTYYHPDVLSRLRDCPVPGVPKIHELIQDGDTLIVIEDYIHGETVAQLLERRGTLSENESVSIIRQLCEILRPLHAASPPIVHRDIKPSNLILSQDGTLYLIDFNAAKTSQKAASRDTDLIGTHGYAAPEQYGFAPSGPATDIYAIGVLFNVLLTGVFPHVRTAGGIPGLVIKTCTAIDPARRYSSVSRLSAALPNSSRPAASGGGTPEPASWLPPGFRTKTWWKMLLAGGYYALTLLLSAFQEVTNEQGELIHGLDLLCNQITFFLFCIIPVFVLADYRGLCRRLPLQNRPLARWFVRIPAAAIAALIPVIVLIMIESFGLL